MNHTKRTTTHPLIIAELSGNHQQDKSIALELIKAAADAGADAIKLQTYTADSMTLDMTNDDFLVNEEGSLWQGESLYSLYQKASTPYEWHEELFKYARSLGMLAFSSPFDLDAVDFLDGLDVPYFKIASFEITDLPLIRHVASKGKPLIISTGMASIEEIQAAIDTANARGCYDITLLKCTSTYPASASNSHLKTIKDMRERFGLAVGLSDHSMGIGVAVAAVAMGVTMIEKHLVLERESDAVDAGFSMTPVELRQLVIEVKRASDALGEVKYGGSADEQASKKYRRSIYACADIKAGEPFSSDNVRIIRPSYGLPPVEWDRLLNQVAAQDIAVGTALQWHMVKSVD